MRSCIFCQRQADSKEHLFPQWLDREFPQPAGTLLPVTHRVGDRVSQRPNTRIAHMEVRCVCKACNSGWMSTIEARLKPFLLQMIKGERVSLTMNDQLDVSLWATLKAMVAEMAGEYEAVTTQEERDLVMSQLRAPANVRVFLATLDEGNHYVLLRVYVLGQRTAATTELESAYATTFVLGHLVLQVVGSPTSQTAGLAEEGIVRPSWQTITPPVIPSATWPLATVLRTDQLEEFAQSQIQVRHRDDSSRFPSERRRRAP
jgi:hypothetical protein